MLAFVCLGVDAQSNLGNTPYSRYGYGREMNPTMARNRGMGGIGVGVRTNQQINPMNPASYTAMDSLTFLFDLGLHVVGEEFKEAGESQKKWNGGIDYLAAQFPIGKKMAAALAYLPYTYVGYNYGQQGTLDDNDDIYYEKAYSGSGGLNKAMIGLSYAPFSWLAIGANVGYIYGTTTNSSYTLFSSSVAESAYIYNNLSANGFDVDAGIQITKTFNGKHMFVLGGTFAPKVKFKVNAEYIENVGSSVADTVTSRHNLHLPEKYGVGITYTYAKKFTIGADYRKENWGDVRSLNYELQEVDGDLRDKYTFAVGAEYQPNAIAREYFKRVRYRVGFHTSDSYIQVENSKNKEYGISVGLGLPLKNQK